MSDRHADDTDADLPPQPPLDPCPFCGTTPVLLLAGNGHGYFVSCENAACHINPENTFNTDTPEQAAQRWNTRAVPAHA